MNVFSRICLSIGLLLALQATALAQYQDHNGLLVSACGNVNAVHDASCQLDPTAADIRWICTWGPNVAHRLVGNVSVPWCATLVVQPSTGILVLGPYTLSVYGALKIHATEQTRAVMAYSSNGLNADATQLAGSWGGLTIYNGNQNWAQGALTDNKLSGLLLSGTTNGLDLTGLGSVNDRAVLTAVTVFRSWSVGIRIQNSGISLNASVINSISAGDGLVLGNRSDALVDGLQVSQVYRAGILLDHANRLELKKSTITVIGVAGIWSLRNQGKNTLLALDEVGISDVGLTLVGNDQGNEDGIRLQRTDTTITKSGIIEINDRGIDAQLGSLTVSGSVLSKLGGDGILHVDGALRLTTSVINNYDDRGVSANSTGQKFDVLVENCVFHSAGTFNTAAIEIGSDEITAELRFNTLDAGNSPGFIGILASGGTGVIIGNLVTGFFADGISWNKEYQVKANNSFGSGTCNYFRLDKQGCQPLANQNLALDPHYRDKSILDFRLGQNSPTELFNAIAPGDPLLVAPAPTLDILLNARVDHLDIGAIESLVLKSIAPQRGRRGTVLSGVKVSGFNFKQNQTNLTFHAPGNTQNPDANLTIPGGSLQFDPQSHLHIATIQLSIAAAATLGFRDVIASDPQQISVLNNGFLVVSNPMLNSVALTPDSGAQGATLKITISGADFITQGNQQPTVVLGTGSDGVQLSVDSVTADTIVVSVTLPDALPADSKLDLKVTNPDGESVEKKAAFTIIKKNLPPGDPTLVAPANGFGVNTLQPTLVIQNASDPENDPLLYRFQLSESADFSAPLADYGAVAPTNPNSSKQVESPLIDGKTYYWRVRAEESITNGKPGPWSETWSFTVTLIQQVDAGDDDADGDQLSPDQQVDAELDLTGDSGGDVDAVDDLQLDSTSPDQQDLASPDGQQKDLSPQPDQNPVPDLGGDSQPQPDLVIRPDSGGQKDLSDGADTGTGGVTTLSGGNSGSCQAAPFGGGSGLWALLLLLGGIWFRRRRFSS